MEFKIIFFLVAVLISASLLPEVLGHGLGSETLPPQLLGDRTVAMEVSSTVDNSTQQKQMLFSMFDTNTGLTVRDVIFDIKAVKNDQVLFDQQFSASNGMVTIDFIPDENEQVKVEGKNKAGVFDMLIGSEKKTVEARGKIFEQAGLYKFTIGIVSAEHYSSKTQKPVTFESGISFAQTVPYTVNDDSYGKQEVKIVSYYDLLGSIQYNQNTNAISFSMPFEWTKNNLSQTSVIHQEILIPKTFGSLQVESYEISVNGFVIPDNTITIDDYSTGYRILHILLYQAELEDLFGKQKNPGGSIEFSVRPKSHDLYLVESTENIEYKFVLTEPQPLIPGQQNTLQFKVYDIFLQGKTVSVSYDAIVKSGGTEIYRTSGVSSDSKDKWNEIKFNLSKDTGSKITVLFENVDGNKNARAEMTVTIPKQTQQYQIPQWIKNNAGWWCQKSISDDEFLKGIGYLIGQGIIKVDAQYQNSDQKSVPQWIRNNSCWWSDNSISDNEFVNGIAYLVENGIIKP